MQHQRQALLRELSGLQAMRQFEIVADQLVRIGDQLGDLAVAEVAQKKLVVELEQSADVRRPWLEMVSACEIRGKKTHDTCLVAVMKVHGVTHLLTFNRDDYKPFPGITLSEPLELLATPS